MKIGRSLDIAGSFSLAQTCGPVQWGRGRWPNIDWIDEKTIWVGWENDQVVFRIAHASGAGSTLTIEGTASPELDLDWANRTLGARERLPVFADQVIAELAGRFPGMRPHASGTLFEGLVDSIVGQSITVQAAAVVSGRLAAAFHPGLEILGRIFWPAPRPSDLASADVARVRRTGVTWKRAEALVEAGKAALDGRLPLDDQARIDPDAARNELRTLPLVGPWTVESALLWGLGSPDAFPNGDVALLRAARLAYHQPEMSMADLVTISGNWPGARGWASRLLWTGLLGPAPTGP